MQTLWPFWVVALAAEEVVAEGAKVTDGVIGIDGNGLMVGSTEGIGMSVIERTEGCVFRVLGIFLSA